MSYSPASFSACTSSCGVDGPAVFVHPQDVAKDAAVGVVVEVVGPQDQGDFVADFGQQQQAAEHGPLGFDAPRRLAIQQLAQPFARFSPCVGGVRSTVAMESILRIWRVELNGRQRVACLVRLRQKRRGQMRAVAVRATSRRLVPPARPTP